MKIYSIRKKLAGDRWYNWYVECNGQAVCQTFSRNQARKIRDALREKADREV